MNVSEALAKQAAVELDASQRYLSLTLWAKSQSWSGAAAFLSHASDEEREHGKKILEHLNDYADILPACPAVAEAQETPLDLLDCFDTVLKMEMAVTKALSTLYGDLHDAGDYDCASFIERMLHAQIASVEEARDIVRLLKNCDGTASLLIADGKIGELV